MKKTDPSIVTFERYIPKLNSGLTLEDVKVRQSAGFTNLVNQKYSKSYLSIFASNIFTYFNLLGLIVFVALLCIESAPANFFFVFFYIANTVIGIIQELRAKVFSRFARCPHAKDSERQQFHQYDLKARGENASEALGDITLPSPIPDLICQYPQTQAGAVRFLLLHRYW